MKKTRYRPALCLLTGALLLPASGGCDWVTGDPTPEEARIVLEGDPDAQVEILLSKNFLTAQQPDGNTLVEILDVQFDTVSPPFSRTFNIREEQQFFARAEPADSTVETNVRMQVFVDDESRYDQTRDLREEYLQFIFLFNRPLLDATVEVL